MKRRLYGTLYLLLATVIWGGAFVAQSTGMDYMGPFTFQAARCLLAVIALVIMTVITDCRTPWRFLKKWRDARLWKAGLLCGLALFASTNLQQAALVTTDAGKAGFITALYIVFVPILSIFRKRMPGINAFISVGIAIAGMYLLCGGNLGALQIGDILLIGCAITFAVQIILVDMFAQGVDPLRLNCIQALVVTVLSIVPALLFEAPDIRLIADCWLPLTFAGVLSMGLAYSLQIYGQQRLESTPAALIMSLESVFAAISGALLLGETMSPGEKLGCGLMFIAVILSQLHFPKRNRRT